MVTMSGIFSTKSSKICFGIWLTISVIFLIFGIFVACGFKSVINNIIDAALPLNSPETKPVWLNPQLSTKFQQKFYFYHVLNPDDFLLNTREKPNLAQIGPIVYDVEWKKDNVSWRIHENSVDYGLKKIYTFNEKDSVVSEDTYITVLNLPWMSALTKLKYGTGNFTENPPQKIWLTVHYLEFQFHEIFMLFRKRK